MNSHNTLESKEPVLDVDKNSETETILESTEVLNTAADAKIEARTEALSAETMTDNVLPIDYNQCLQELAEAQQQKSIQSLFDQDPKRVENFSIDFNEIHVDFSKHQLDAASKQALLEYATECQLEQKRAALFAGEKINTTEKRAVLHMALRGHLEDAYQVDQQPVMPEVLAVREKCFSFAESSVA